MARSGRALRVVHLDSALEWRGGQTQLLLLVRELGTSVEQHVVLPPGAALRSALRDQPAEVTPFGGVLALRRRLAELRPDVVAAHTSRAHTLALLAGAGPLVVHRRVDFSPRLSWKYRVTPGFVAVSDAVAAVLRRSGVAPERIQVVRDGVDLHRWQRPEPVELGVPRPFVLAVGALVPHKGHVHLVDALRQLPGLHAVILGEGPLRASLAARARTQGVAARLHLPGAVADPRPWYASAAVVVHPSVEEGLGQALIEAFLCGAAVVATDAGGVPEVVAGRGLLVPRGDAGALANGIRAAIAEPHRFRADRAEVAAQFGAARMAAETLSAWGALTRPAEPRRAGTSWWPRRSRS